VLYHYGAADAGARAHRGFRVASPGDRVELREPAVLPLDHA
jgi:hypothetical protein